MGLTILKYVNNDNVPNPRLSPRNSSLKLFWLPNVWVDNILFSAHYKKSPKINENPIYHKQEISLIFLGKSYYGLPWSRQDAVAHQGLRGIIGVVSKLNGANSKIHWGLSMIPYFPLGEQSYVILSRRSKIQTLFRFMDQIFTRKTLQGVFNWGTEIGRRKPICYRRNMLPEFLYVLTSFTFTEAVSFNILNL